jgi:hypothetical protein
MSESHTTTNHEEIKRWVEARGGKPIHIKGTGDGADPGILRIEFPEEEFEGLSWDDFFRKFDESKLAFLYQEKLADGRESRFHKFINR